MKGIRLATAVLCAALPLAHAHAEPPVSATIRIPTISPADTGDVALHARCAYASAGEPSQGIFGYVVDISAGQADGDHTFALTWEIQAIPADIDVIFFEDIGTCGGPASVTGSFQAQGEEAGTIPIDTTRALILSQGAPNVTFTFSINP